MTNEELQTLVAQNSQDIAGLKQVLSALIVDTIRPLSDRSVSLEQLAENTSQIAADTAQRSAKQSQQILEQSIQFSEYAQIIQNILDEARADRTAYQSRFDAQQEILRSILLELRSTNSRLENLEAS
ncbi:MAG: hypothetical protein AAFP20_01295 [Cyanobacteria bacterium J06614_10]